MIVTRDKGHSIRVRHRDEDGNRVESRFSQRPYFFLRSEEDYLCDALLKETGYRGIYGEDLTKIVVSHPNDIYEFTKTHPHVQTWEANVPFQNRVLSDRIESGDSPIKNYDHRVWYLDCEWNPTTNAMRVMVFHDSFLNKTECLYVNPNYNSNKTHRRDAKGRLEYPDEESMLNAFLVRLREADPDIITGWYVVGADIKTIIERCRACNLNPSRMSPYRRLGYSFRDWAQPIPGINCIDLMIAFSKLWELKNGKLPGYKLDDVAKEALGEQKVELPDGHDTYHTNLDLYLDYAIQDVELLPKLDVTVNALGYYTALQHLVQCDITTTPFITKMFTCLTLQDKKFDKRIPTRPMFDYEAYEGADVMDVDKGVYDDVGILDIKAMYHSNASLHNISWETLDESNERESHYEDCGNGTYFYKGKKGLLVRQMDNMTELRNKFKRLMVTDGDNYDRWDTMQFACKSLVASMYGVAGDSKYGMYHPKIAGAITFTSRATLNRLKVLAEKAGSKVLYGHTDSVFCHIPSPAVGLELIASINKEMAPIEVEFEKWCRRMILMAKNRYAGLVTWTDGTHHSPSLYVKGIEMKQSRMPPVMKDTMSLVIEGILAGRHHNDVTTTVQDTIADILNGKIHISHLAMKGKLDKNLSEYKVLSGNAAAASWSNEFLGKGYTKGSFFKVILNSKGKYVAFDSEEDIEHIALGSKIMIKRFILDKIEPYYNLVGWSMQPILNTYQGLGNMTWL